jgi:hypothetical protein
MITSVVGLTKGALVVPFVIPIVCFNATFFTVVG